MGNMKANRKFVEGKEAVSAVIGVILMVAITVAIAATVYVYVSGMLGGQGTTTPTVGVTYSPSTKQFTIGNPSASDIKWTDVACKLINGSVVTWEKTITKGGLYVTAGDVIDVSAAIGMDTGHTYTFSLLYNVTSGAMYTYTWTQT